LADQPEMLHHLQRIASNCSRLDKMIADLLVFGRLARHDVTMQPIGLDQLVRDLVQNYPALQAPHADLHVEPLSDVLGHEPSIIQAVSNLLTNAAKFVKPGCVPKIHVWTESRDGDVRLWVADEGIGIKPMYQHRLYNMFERIHPDLDYEGTGVGLAIVRKAVERMNGQVGMESDGETGSRFWIQLPAVPEP
jgi:signal transduction histidine kinase